jgi:hypothetical protein
VVMTSGNEKIWTTIMLPVLTDGNKSSDNHM